MSDNVQKIKEEIERRISQFEAKYPKDLGGYWNDEESAAYDCAEEYKRFLQFIDSLPEEPTSEDTCLLGHDYKNRNCENCSFELCKRFSKPVNEDLEEEIERCWKKMFPNGWSDYTLLTLTYEEHKAFANHFAEWQKQQMKETLQTEYEKGQFDMQQEMMKDAVDATIFSELKGSDGSVFQVKSDRFRMDGAKIGDRIKVIPIKIEQQ